MKAGVCNRSQLTVQFNFSDKIPCSVRANFSTGRAAFDNCPIELQLRGIPANQGLHSGDSQGCTTAWSLWDLRQKEIKICLQTKLNFQFNGGEELYFVTMTQTEVRLKGDMMSVT